MSLTKHILFWLLAFAAFLAFLLVFRAILLPFVAGMALAYLLDPVADRLETYGFNRLVATLTILVVFVLLFVAFFVMLVPVLGHQLSGLTADMPGYVQRLQELLFNQLGDRLGRLTGMTTQDLKTSLGNLVGQGAGWLGDILKSLWSGGQALISLVSLIVVTPVVAFYLIYDWNDIIEKIDGWLPRDHRDQILRLVGQMDAAVSGFVRGQVSVCLLLGAFYAIGLVLVGLKFGLLIGIGAGLVSFIPFVGATLGLLVSLVVAFVQFWPDWPMVAVVFGIFLVGQFLEGNILQPKLVGTRVGLHPVWLMFALFAFGYLFGFVGMLIAVPASAAIGVLARFALEQYLSSALYYGTAHRVSKTESADQ